MRKEIVIFENAQHSCVYQNVQNIVCCPAFAAVNTAVSSKSEKKTGDGSKCDEQKEPDIPPSVKQIACKHYKHVLQAVTAPKRPIYQENARQEKQVGKGIESHR